LLERALLVSDNHAASALARNYPGGMGSFLAAAQQKIGSLQLTRLTCGDHRSARGTGRATASETRVLSLPTQRRQWHFFGLATGLLWKRSLANDVEKSALGDSSRSRAGNPDRDKKPAERLHLKVANSRCRP